MTQPYQYGEHEFALPPPLSLSASPSSRSSPKPSALVQPLAIQGVETDDRPSVACGRDEQILSQCHVDHTDTQETVTLHAPISAAGQLRQARLADISSTAANTCPRVESSGSIKPTSIPPIAPTPGALQPTSPTAQVTLPSLRSLPLHLPPTPQAPSREHCPPSSHLVTPAPTRQIYSRSLSQTTFNRAPVGSTPIPVETPGAIQTSSSPDRPTFIHRHSYAGPSASTAPSTGQWVYGIGGTVPPIDSQSYHLYQSQPGQTVYTRQQLDSFATPSPAMARLNARRTPQQGPTDDRVHPSTHMHPAATPTPTRTSASSNRARPLMPPSLALETPLPRSSRLHAHAIRSTPGYSDPVTPLPTSTLFQPGQLVRTALSGNLAGLPGPAPWVCGTDYPASYMQNDPVHPANKDGGPAAQAKLAARGPDKRGGHGSVNPWDYLFDPFQGMTPVKEKKVKGKKKSQKGVHGVGNGQSGNDEDADETKHRQNFKHWQIEVMEVLFTFQNTPTRYEKQRLGAWLGVKSSRITIWFQNRRQDLARRSKALQSSGAAPSSSPTSAIGGSSSLAFQAYQEEPPAPPPGRTNLGSWDPDSGKWRTVPTACIGALAGPRPDREAILRAIVTGEIDRDDYIDANPDYAVSHPGLSDNKFKLGGEETWDHVPPIDDCASASTAGGVMSSAQMRAQAEGCLGRSAMGHPSSTASGMASGSQSSAATASGSGSRSALAMHHGNSGPTGVPMGRWVRHPSRLEEVMAARDSEAPVRQYRRSEQPVPAASAGWQGDHEALLSMMPSDPPSMGMVDMMGSDAAEEARLAPMEDEEDYEDDDEGHGEKLETGEEVKREHGIQVQETPVRKRGHDQARILSRAPALSDDENRPMRGLPLRGPTGLTIDRPTLGRATSYDILRSSRRAKQLADNQGSSSSSHIAQVYGDENGPFRHATGNRPLQRSVSGMTRSLSSIGENKVHQSGKMALTESSKRSAEDSGTDRLNKRARPFREPMVDLDMQVNYTRASASRANGLGTGQSNGGKNSHDLQINIDIPIPRGGRFDIKIKPKSSFSRGADVLRNVDAEHANAEAEAEAEADVDGPSQMSSPTHHSQRDREALANLYPYLRPMSFGNKHNSRITAENDLNLERTPASAPGHGMDRHIPMSGSTNNSTPFTHLQTPDHQGQTDDVFDSRGPAYSKRVGGSVLMREQISPESYQVNRRAGPHGEHALGYEVEMKQRNSDGKRAREASGRDVRGAVAGHDYPHQQLQEQNDGREGLEHEDVNAAENLLAIFRKMESKVRG